MGNFWWDLTEPDIDGDGTVDVAYPLGGTEDRYPTVSFVSEPWAISAVCYDNDVTLDWNSPNRTDFAPVIRYEVSRVCATGMVSFMTTDRSIVDGDVKAYGAVIYTVRAWTELGPGPWGPPVVVEIPDTAPPTVSILSPSPGAWLRTTTVLISWSGSDDASGIAYYEVSVDGRAFLNVSLSASYGAQLFSSGAHRATVRATDVAGNAAEATVTFNLDLTAPTISVISPSSGSVIGSPSVSISITVSDAGSGYHRDLIRIDGQLVRDSTNVNSISFSIELDDGLHRLSMASTDRAGNVATVYLQFTVDSHPADHHHPLTDRSFVDIV